MTPRATRLQRLAHDALTTAIVLAILGLLAVLARGAYGKPPSVDQELATLLARVAAHEGALQSPRDLELVWQVVQNNAASNLKRLRFLERHCPQVAGVAPCRANCWARGITAATLPADVAAGEQGYWRRVVLPRYAALEKRAHQLVWGMRYERPCAGSPTTWGSPVLDHDRAVRLGMRQHVCKGTLNEAWSWP